MRLSHQESFSRKATAFRLTACLLFIIFLLPGWVSAGVFLKDGTDVSGDDTLTAIMASPLASPDTCQVEFFYNIHCGACHVAMAYLTEYQAAHPDLVISSHDLFNSTENKALFEEYKKEFNRPYVAVPVVYIGGVGLEGESAIREFFDPLATRWCQAENETLIHADSGKEPEKPAHRTVISIPLVLIAGLIDGINPCAVGILVFLLVLLITVRKKERIIPVGIVFTAGVFFFYFLSGTGIIPLTGTSGFVKGVSLGAGVLSVIAALIIFLASAFPGIRSTIIRPGSPWRESALWCSRLAVPLSFILGLLMGILELPCAGGIYITILDMISFRVNMVQGLVYLILYNLSFIIPLVLMTVFVNLAMKKPQEAAAEAGDNGLQTTGIFPGLLLLVFAFLVLSGLM